MRKKAPINQTGKTNPITFSFFSMIRGEGYEIIGTHDDLYKNSFLIFARKSLDGTPVTEKRYHDMITVSMPSSDVLRLFDKRTKGKDVKEVGSLHPTKLLSDEIESVMFDGIGYRDLVTLLL